MNIVEFRKLVGKLAIKFLIEDKAEIIYFNEDEYWIIKDNYGNVLFRSYGWFPESLMIYTGPDKYRSASVFKLNKRYIELEPYV